MSRCGRFRNGCGIEQKTNAPRIHPGSVCFVQPSSTRVRCCWSSAAVSCSSCARAAGAILDLQHFLAGGGSLLGSVSDAVQNGPAGKHIVKEVIGKAEEIADIHLNVGLQHDIGQLSAVAVQVGLQFVDAGLRFVQFGIFGQIGDQSAAEEIPCSPAFGTVQRAGDGIELLQLPPGRHARLL